MLEHLPKLAGETRRYSADFTKDLAAAETISSQSCAATVYSGADGSPSSIISGSASASGGVVSQNLTGGVVGVFYDLLWTAVTSASRTLCKRGLVAVLANTP